MTPQWGVGPLVRARKHAVFADQAVVTLAVRLLLYGEMQPQVREAGHYIGEDLMPNQNLEGKQSGGIVIPALLWWAGTPLLVVIVLWALFFR